MVFVTRFRTFFGSIFERDVRRSVGFLIIVGITWVTTGCSRLETEDRYWRQDNGKLKVLTTLAMINDLVQQIGKDRIDTISLIRADLDPHSYELVKGDDEKFARADLIFYNGLGLEHGLSLRQNLENNPKAVAVTETLLRESPEVILTVDGQYDPHVWMDIALWMHTVEPIVEALAAKDPEYALEYRERGRALQDKMMKVDAQIFAQLQAVKEGKRYLVTSHDAFHYFTRHYLALNGETQWYKRCRAPEGLAPEAHMSVSDVIAIVDHIEAFHIGVLFPESNVSQDALRKIVDATKQRGFSIRVCQETLFGDSMGAASSYLNMMMHNAEVIFRELNNE
jgi:manganese/zinc/iron transport system substrate-binding protein